MMKRLLKTSKEKCKGLKICEKTCSKTFFKREDSTRSAIQVSKQQHGFELNVCNQCGDCIKVCPALALSRNKMGVVALNKNLCTGCYICVGFCPTSSMRYHPELREPFKCIACGACAKTCPEKALILFEQPL